MKYIDADKLIAILNDRIERCEKDEEDGYPDTTSSEATLKSILSIVASLQQEQSDYMIQWTGNNLKDVIDFTGRSPRFGEWFKSWEEYENYVHTHNDILKLFCEDGSHYEVPVGAWIVKTPDGYNVPSVSRFIQTKQEQPEVDLEKEITPSLVKNMLYEFGVQSIDDMDSENLAEFARHFYELGLNTRKED